MVSPRIDRHSVDGGASEVLREARASKREITRSETVSSLACTDLCSGFLTNQRLSNFIILARAYFKFLSYVQDFVGQNFHFQLWFHISLILTITYSYLIPSKIIISPFPQLKFNYIAEISN